MSESQIDKNEHGETDYVVGLDESHRGCLFGPVYVGCTMFDEDVKAKIPDIIKIGDSKKMSKKAKDLAFDWIKQNAKHFSIRFCTEDEIDQLNISKATVKAWHQCLDEMKYPIRKILVDGIYFEKYNEIEHECILQGDSKVFEISAASILAKVAGDRHVKQLCDMYPFLDQRYGLCKNMGYGSSKIHANGLEKFGPSTFHRKNFKPCKENKSGTKRPIHLLFE